MFILEKPLATSILFLLQETKALKAKILLRNKFHRSPVSDFGISGNLHTSVNIRGSPEFRVSLLLVRQASEGD